MAMAVEDPARSVTEPGSISCAACGGDRVRDYLEHERGTYVACVGCGLVRAQPLPAADHMRARADYWARRQNLSAAKLGRSFDPRHQRLAYGTVLDRLAPFARTGRLLEIGCGAGGFLDAATSKGWRATGIELAVDAARWARQERGLDVHWGTVESVALPDELANGGFDAAVMLDVIEHVVDPLSLLRIVWHRLRPGGALLVMTPNARGLGARCLGPRWEACDPIDHVWLFQPRNLAGLCQRAGFQPRRWWCIDINPLQFRRGSPARQPPAQQPPAQQPPAPVEQRSRFIQRVTGSRLLRWGRGLANAVLSAFDLGDKLYLLATKPD